MIELTALVGLAAFALSGLPFALNALDDLFPSLRGKTSGLQAAALPVIGAGLVVVGSASLLAHVLLTEGSEYLVANYAINLALWTVTLLGALAAHRRVARFAEAAELMAKKITKSRKPAIKKPNKGKK